MAKRHLPVALVVLNVDAALKVFPPFTSSLLVPVFVKMLGPVLKVLPCADVPPKIKALDVKLFTAFKVQVLTEVVLVFTVVTSPLKVDVLKVVVPGFSVVTLLLSVELSNDVEPVLSMINAPFIIPLFNVKATAFTVPLMVFAPPFWVRNLRLIVPFV